LEETPKILHRDHENARHLAEGLARIEGITIDPKNVVTNIVIFEVNGTGRTAAEICEDLGRRGILCEPTRKFAVRMVTHYDVDRAGIERAISAMQDVVSSIRGRAPVAARFSR